MTTQTEFNGGFHTGDVVEVIELSDAAKKKGFKNPCKVIDWETYEKEGKTNALPEKREKNIPIKDSNGVIWWTEKQSLKIISTQDILEGTTVTFMGLEGTISYKEQIFVSTTGERYYPILVGNCILFVSRNTFKVVIKIEEPNPFELIEL